MKNIAIPAAALVLCAAGCRTNKDILNDYEKDLLVGNYAHAGAEVSQKAQEEGVDQLLWQLQAGGAAHFAANVEKAIAHFDRAEDIFIDNDATSVFGKGASGAYAMMTNDRVFPFAGTGQDRIFACLYKAIDYAAANRVDAVRTELNRAAQHQTNWIDDRRKDIVAAKERMQKDAAAYARENKSETVSGDETVNKAFADASFGKTVREKTGFDPATDGNLDLLSQKDYMNVYVQHVCGVFRWLTDGANAASGYFKGLPELAPANAMLAADLRETAKGAKPRNQVWIYVEDGLCPCREESRFDLPLILIPGLNRYVMYAGMAVPYLRYRSAGCASYSVSGGGAERPLELLQDVDKLLKVEHDVYMRGALAREITRVVVKTGVQIALGVSAEHADSYTAAALKASQYAAAAWAASVTQADLRSWTALPKAVYAVRLTRPADGKIVLRGNGANLVTLTVPEGNSVVFVNKPAPAAAPVVRLTRF